MLIREHRGGVDESMQTVKEIEPTRKAICEIINDSYKGWPFIVTEDLIKVEKYAYDDRIKWDTYIVTIDNYGPFGFTNGPTID